MSIIPSTLPKSINWTIKNHILSEQFDIIEKSKTNNHTRHIPYGIINSLIKTSKIVTPRLTYNTMMGYYRKRNREWQMVDIPEPMLDWEPVHEEVVELLNITEVRGLGRQPTGDTHNKRKIGEMTVNTAFNEITLEYQRIYTIMNRKNRHVKSGYLWSLIYHIKVKNNILATTKILESTIFSESEGR